MTGRLMIAVGLAAVLAGPADAGPERVALPTNYSTDFVRYNVVDRPDRKRVRFMYVNREALDAARPGEPLPDGTVLIMEDHDAELDASGELRRDDEGRLIPLAAVANIFIMEKQAGWGAAVPEEIRNGDWDYAWYLPDGSLRPELDTTGCFTCHLRREARDYTFTFFKNVEDGLK